MEYKNKLPNEDYLAEDPSDYEIEKETCDLYGAFGNPSGNEHHACLNELFGGDGFHIEDIF